MDYSFKIINSSAGSGKTFNLAIEYISKLLNSKDDEHFKSMLALTFTNKASAEMKDRILFNLSNLKHQRDKIVLEIISKRTGLDQSTIKKKSSNILEKILYNYSNFNVITIDSFTNNIIRTVNGESENKDDFIVELDNLVYLDQAVEELISEINEDNELKELLVEFAKFKLTINRSWDISYDLKDFGLFIDKESNRDQVEYFKKMNIKFFSQIRKKIIKLKTQKTINIYDLVNNTFKLININDLNDNDFKLFSFDLGPSAEDVEYNDYFYITKSAVIDKSQIKKRIQRDLSYIKRRFKGIIALENLNYFPTPAYSTVCDADFIKEVI